eukprot:m51a1_g4580 hypothetical protein (145) ;mRNA; r:170824-171560
MLGSSGHAYLCAKNELYADPEDAPEGQRHRFLVVSVGTGCAKKAQRSSLTPEEVRSWGPLSWLNPGAGNILDTLLDSNAVTTDANLRELLGGDYVRFQHQLVQAQSDMDDASPENIADLLNEGAHFVEQNRDRIAALLGRLGEP